MPGVNNDCYIHYYIQKQTTSIGDILVFPCTGVDTMADSSQFTQGGSKVRRSCQSTIVGGACTELRHSDRNLRTVWFEKEDLKKNTGWIFIIVGWMRTHTSNTHLCSNNKWILHPMTPLMLLRGGINAFTQQLQLYALILGAETGLSRHNLVWLLYAIAFLHWNLSRHRAAFYSGV